MNVNCELKLQIAMSLRTSTSYIGCDPVDKFTCAVSTSRSPLSLQIWHYRTAYGENPKSQNIPQSSVLFHELLFGEDLYRIQGSFSYSQKHATRPYPKPDESSLHLHCPFPLNPSQLSCCLSGSARLPTILAAKNSVTPCPKFPFRAICPTHLTL